jgi:3-deoxy-D-manno-octulosonic-acid transferase
MIYFYTILFYLAIPFILLRLLWRSIKAPAYRHRWCERFALYNKNYPQDVIWFHAVSVGESEAVFPLVKQIQKQHPNLKVLITTTTPTGSARVQAVMQDTVIHVYLPYDMPDSIYRFMRCFKPKLAVIMETEIWPNLFLACGKRRIPLYIINARLSEKSSRRYQKISSLIRPALTQVSLVATQTDNDAKRFISIGAENAKVKTFGNIKFDVKVPIETIEQGLQIKNNLFAGRFVWLIASSHKDEESIFFTLYQDIKKKIPELLLVIVPRHPERFSEVKKQCDQQHLVVVLRTSKEKVNLNTDVYLADTLGELKMLYASSDVAFVGGSMVPNGGHNVLEAAAVDVPIMFGPYMSNFNDIAHRLLAANAALQCQDREALISNLLMLYKQSSYRAMLVENAKGFLIQNQGATDKICKTLSLAMVE